MTYISIDDKTKQAKKMIELLETLPFAKVLKEPNSTTKKAIGAAKKRAVKKYQSSKQLFEALNK
jgi:antitoxin component of RelBE/YafQ-DinJ toxin-antitoxin module